jgi:hypothetical protein
MGGDEAVVDAAGHSPEERPARLQEHSVEGDGDEAHDSVQEARYSQAAVYYAR